MELIKNILSFFWQPIWAHGLECNICKVSYDSARQHLRNVQELGEIKSHEGKVPILKR